MPKSFHALVGIFTVAWDLTITMKGPEKALIPSQLPSDISTIIQYWAWLAHPSANLAQVTGMHVNRVINTLSHRITYTLSITDPAFYGTKTYFLSNCHGVDLVCHGVDSVELLFTF
jgi:hypothetical protein